MELLNLGLLPLNAACLFKESALSLRNSFVGRDPSQLNGETTVCQGVKFVPDQRDQIIRSRF